MSPNKFDRHIRAQLQHHRKAVDAEEIWAAVAPQRPRRRIGMWWFMGLFLAMGLSFAYGWSQGSKHETTKKLVQLKKGPSTPMTVEDVSQAELPATPSLPAPVADITVAKPAPETPPKSQTSSSIQYSTNVKEAPLDLPSSANKPDSSLPPITTPEASMSVFTPTVSPISQERAAAILAPLSEKILAPMETTPLSLDIIPILPIISETLKFKKSSGLFLDLQAGLYAPIQSLITDSDSLDDTSLSWLEERKTSESTLEAWSIDLSLGYQHRSGWYLKSGLGYSQLLEQFEFSESSIERDSVEGTTRIFIDSNGDSTLVTGMIERTTTRTFYQRNYNSFRSIDIPILFGYRFGQDRLGLIAEGGLRFNIQQQVEGVRRGIDANMIDLAESPDFRTTIGLSLQAGIGLNWQWTPSISLSANTSMRYFTGDVTKKDALVQERYQWLGGQVGLRWYF